LPAARTPGEQDQDDTLRIEIVRSNLRIPIAVPVLETRTAALNDAARQIAEIVREDLRRVDIFNLADSAVYSSVGRHSHTDIHRIPFDRYADYYIDAVLLGTVEPAGGQAMRVESRLFSVRDKSTLFGKGITGTPDQIRQIAHAISSNILYHFTGDFGVFRTKLYYTSTRDLGPNTQNAELWSMDFDGHNQRRITYSNSLKLFPHIGPPGSGLVYTSFINDNADVYLLRASGGDAVVVFSSDAADMTPAISPDGREVVFSSSVVDDNMDIYVCNLDGSNRQRLTTHWAIDTNPCWSPDGRQIAFTSERTGTVQIYIMNADGTNQRRVTFEGTYNDGADWSPDGRFIAYAARRSGSLTFDLRIHDLTTNQTYYVTRDVANDESPSFSPDSMSLAFASDRTGTYQVWTIDIDGTNMRQLTTQGENKHPSWSRGGQ
jgi:TolB protein